MAPPRRQVARKILQRIRHVAIGISTDLPWQTVRQKRLAALALVAPPPEPTSEPEDARDARAEQLLSNGPLSCAPMPLSAVQTNTPNSYAVTALLS